MLDNYFKILDFVGLRERLGKLLSRLTIFGSCPLKEYHLSLMRNYFKKCIVLNRIEKEPNNSIQARQIRYTTTKISL